MHFHNAKTEPIQYRFTAIQVETSVRTLQHTGNPATQTKLKAPLALTADEPNLTHTHEH